MYFCLSEHKVEESNAPKRESKFDKIRKAVCTLDTTSTVQCNVGPGLVLAECNAGWLGQVGTLLLGQEV